MSTGGPLPGPAQDAHWLQCLLDDEARLVAVPAGPLALALLDNLSSPDPHLRDTLSLTLLDRLIECARLGPAERECLLAAAIDERHLFWALGQAGDDSVFSRTFSVLVVGALIEHDREDPQLAPAAVESAAAAVQAYARRERDWRGYIAAKGWAHAVAHTADALGSLAAHPAVPAPGALRLLQCLADLARVPFALGFLEDDRLALAAWRIMRLGKVPNRTLSDWLAGFDIPPEATDVEAGTLMSSNQEHFLRSLYFRWVRADASSLWLEAILAAIDRFDRYGAAALPAE